GLAQPWRLVWQKLIRPALRMTPQAMRKFWTQIHLWIHSLPDSATSVVSRIRSPSHMHRSSRSNRSGAQQGIDQDPTPLIRVGSESSSPIHPSSFRRFPSPIRSEDHGSPSGTSTGGRVGYLPIVVSQAVARVKRNFERLPGTGFLSTFRDGPSVAAMKLSSDQALTVQAARWLLATTSSRGDQISTAQFICSVDKPTFANIFEEHDSWKRLLNMTVGAFEIWFSQPNKENQEAAELFGLVVCRVLLQRSREDDRWKYLTEEALPASNRLGNAFLQTLVPALSKYSPGDPKDDLRILYISVHFAFFKAGIDLEQFQWITDQMSTAQFICSLDRSTCFYMFEDHHCWKHLVKLTHGAFQVWHSQPSKENQEVAELFGLILCRVLLQCSEEDEKWKDVTGESLPLPNRFGKAYMQTVILACRKYSSQTAEDDQRILHIASIYTATTQGINFKEYQWLKSCHLLDGHSDLTTALLSIWAVLAWQIGRANCGLSRTDYQADFEETSSSPQRLADNLGYALFWTSVSIRSLQGDLNSELNAAQGFAMCLQRARELCQNNPWLRKVILTGFGDLILSHIDRWTTSGSTEIRFVTLSVEALLTLRNFLSSEPSSSGTPSPSSSELILSAALMDTVADVLNGDLTPIKARDEKWESHRIFKACIIRMLLQIWQNHPDQNLNYSERSKFFASSCRLWAPLEKEVGFSKTGGFGDEEKLLTSDDLKRVAEFTEWVQTQTLDRYFNGVYGHNRRIRTFNFIVPGADVAINRLYAHFDRRAKWNYHLYDFHGEVALCSRSAYTEDGGIL
ncbi:hypothetical protein FRC01_006833, partial [Tulasnella sp. 417]